MDATIDTQSLIPADESTLLEGQNALKIGRFDEMEPFLMTLVSDSDLWMYISSLGSLTAGRIDEDHSLFPYSAEDTIHRNAGRCGPITAIRVQHADGSYEIWEPFKGVARECVRNLSKSVLGNVIQFEEVHPRLGLTFRYRWSACEQFGFVRTAALVNDGMSVAKLEIVDGLVNLLPPNITYWMLQNMSTLPDAYTEVEVHSEATLATISMASMIVDKAEPAESLLASVVWSRGLEGALVLLNQDQLPGFLRGEPTRPDAFMKGRRACFLLSTALELVPGEQRSWDIAADTHRTQAQVEELLHFLQTASDPRETVREAVQDGLANLARFVAEADGQQIGADHQAVMHHQACVLFNVMRGGIYANGDRILVPDYRSFIEIRNSAVFERRSQWLQSLPSEIVYSDLLSAAEQTGDSDLLRLTYEYLPLTFSRRHGDPSRPWNRFAIRLKNPDGSPLLAYQGNWRDIFQNWEALSLSYPMFLESIIAKFVNASTVDGFNPYRIMREGIEWEMPNPNDPWSAIGYWGDHQIIYLLKFLEHTRNIKPQTLASLLGKRLFAYANVPLRFRPYAKIVENPHDCIDFDFELNERIHADVEVDGSDAKLVRDRDGSVYHATLAEKLLVPALSKLSNLVVDGGIWMNSQRPEWNDANNALAGNGISMVTLCYLRRYLAFCMDLFSGDARYEISNEVAEWLEAVAEILAKAAENLPEGALDDAGRRVILDQLGMAFEKYRSKVYASGFSGRREMASEAIRHLCQVALPILDHSVRHNRRDDGLYHGYNIVDLREAGKAKISRLQEMLEGQVAVLSAGVLDPSEVLRLTDALFASKLYIPSRDTFILYPDRSLPGFLQKNVLPANDVESNPLLKAMAAAGDGRIIERDIKGQYRFHPSFSNGAALAKGLSALESDSTFGSLAKSARSQTLDAYESVFRHRFFTGRSGGMYAYEGLGSIYWHMVSKLLVAVQECYFHAEASGAPTEHVKALGKAYYRVRKGMGFNQDSRGFGAFPPDPYSHTPSGRGAKQPGMTGQSKEDILARWMELGIFPVSGRLRFHPSLLRKSEFLQRATDWRVRGVDGRTHSLPLPEGALGFTVCGVPVSYALGARKATTVIRSDGSRQTFESLELDAALSESVFARSGEVSQIEVAVTAESLFA